MEFRTPLLLLGLAAAAIPVVLHLLSSVRAPEVFFPTLRFLHISMHKTARRRRLEHWLLLLIRSLLLALLALAVAEPFLRARAGFLADPRTAVVVIVDNSYSMAVPAGGRSRFDHARREAAALLGGEVKPSQAALMLTNAAAQAPVMRSDLEPPRETLAAARMASGRAAVAERVADAVRMLHEQSSPRKAIYIFSDLQRISFEPLLTLPELKQTKIPLLLVDCSEKRAGNVGIADLTITGRRLAEQPLGFTATLVNSSPTDKVVTLSLHIDGRQRGPSVRKALPAGAKSSVPLGRQVAGPGFHVGHVAINEADDLAIDNVRHFCLEVAGRVQAVLVRGPSPSGGAFDPAGALQLALDPFAARAGPEPPTGRPAAWSVELRTIPAEQLDDDALTKAQVALLADVPSFTEAQADALESFVRRGGSAVFFLGPATDAENYNQRFVERFGDSGGLLPGRIGKPLGQVGRAAPAVRAVRNFTHPYLADLYETPADYPEVLVQRYYRLAAGVAPLEKVLSTPSGDALLAAKDYHAGRVVLCATTASPEWNDLATDALLLSMTARICLVAGDKLGRDHTYAEGAVVSIRPRAAVPANAAINVSGPDGTVAILPLTPGDAGPAATFAKTHKPGVYEWQLAGSGATSEAEGTKGSFVINPDGVETDLAGIDPAALAARLKPAEVFIGKSLQAVHVAAAEAAAGDDLWDRFLVVAIVLLVVEALVANRFRRGAQPIPRHLNPRTAT